MNAKLTKVSNILPGNTPGELSPVVPIRLTNTSPVSLILKDTPKQLDQRADTKSPPSETEKETDARNFPILRGFA